MWGFTVFLSLPSSVILYLVPPRFILVVVSFSWPRAFFQLIKITFNSYPDLLYPEHLFQLETACKHYSTIYICIENTKQCQTQEIP